MSEHPEQARLTTADDNQPPHEVDEVALAQREAVVRKRLLWGTILIAAVLAPASFALGWYEVSRDVDAWWGWTPLMLVATGGFCLALGMFVAAIDLLRQGRG